MNSKLTDIFLLKIRIKLLVPRFVGSFTNSWARLVAVFVSFQLSALVGYELDHRQKKAGEY